MTGKPLTTADYPIVEQRPDLVESARGKPLAELSLRVKVTRALGVLEAALGWRGGRLGHRARSVAGPRTTRHPKTTRARP